VPATVDGVALALDESRGFQRVEEVDEDAVVDPHQVGELTLSDGAAVGEEVEDAELAWLEVVLGEDVANAAREALAERREHDAGPGTGAVEDLACLEIVDAGHILTLPPIVVTCR
jgi:hypothetical protein